MNDMETIAVWFSCGAASAIAAKKTIENYGNTHIVRIVNNPIVEEHEDNQRFLKDVEKWLDREIEFATSKKYSSQSCVEVWDKRQYMSGIAGAPCTQELKKRVRQQWEKENQPDHTVLGFTVDEKGRHDRFCLTEREIIPILINDNISKKDCYKILTDAGIELPAIYKYGFPNANCIGCVKSQSPTYWNLVREKFPEVFQSRAEQSRRIGCKLVRVKGQRIYLDELDPQTKGGKLKNMDIECGIFCEEKNLGG